MPTVQRRGKDQYRIMISKGFGLNGVRQRFTKTVRVPDDKADKLLPKIIAQFEMEIESNNCVNSGKLSFKAFAEEWLSKYAKVNLAPKTLQFYTEALELRIIPAFTKFRLEQIKPMHILQFYENLTEDGIRLDGKKGGLHPKTIQKYHRILSSMFAKAVSWQLIPENPVARVDTPKAKKTEAEFYEEKEVIQLIESLNNAPFKYKVMILLTLHTGIRRSELMGLRWQDIDTSNNLIRIVQTSQYVRGQGTIITDTKSSSSIRKISIPGFFKEMFLGLETEMKHNKAQLLTEVDEMGNPAWHETGLVFTQYNGLPMFPDTITKWFKKFLVSNKLRVINFHGLRHSHATLLISQNLDILALSKRLGHAEASTTLNIYGHALKHSDQKAVQKFQKSIKKKK